MKKTFPHYTQLDMMDCGPSCLRMISKYYGKSYSLQTLRDKCYISREGVSMLGISEAAESLGFKTMGVKISFEQLVEEVQLPCILHWNQNHFVVCYKIKKKNRKVQLYIADPASLCLTYTKDEFLKCWGIKESKIGLALILQPTANFYFSQNENEPLKHSLLYFLGYFMPYKTLLIQLVIGMVIACFLQFAFPILTQSMVDVAIKDRNLNFVSLILIAQLMLFIAQLAIGFIQNWIILHINTRISIALISDFLIKLMKLPLRFFDVKNTGDILQRIDDHDRIQSFLMGPAFRMVFSIWTFFVFASILGYYNIYILTIFAISNLLYALWVFFFMKYRRILDAKRFNICVGEQNKLMQLILGMQDIKLNNCEKQKRWEWEHVQVKRFKVSQSGLAIEQIQQLGSSFFLQATNITVSFYAASSVIAGDMTLGMMMSLTYILGQMSVPVSDFINFVQSYQYAKISLERLNEIHNKNDEEQNTKAILNKLPEKKDIVLDNVYFSYDGANRDYAVEGVSLKIPAGKVTAIVGASGSGKTTIVKLVQGFYKPNMGSIRIGETPLQMISQRLWRSKSGSVMQESFIFSETIAKNIAISTDNIDEERLKEASKMANIYDFVCSLPLGFETKIGLEGNGISHGQRQRLLIARAIYKNPQYVFLDEATNSLDANNEKVIVENLQDFYKGKTVLIVAHRLSTVKNADNIVVLDKGRVIEQGTHGELIRNHSAYYSLIKNQLELGD